MRGKVRNKSIQSREIINITQLVNSHMSISSRFFFLNTNEYIFFLTGVNLLRKDYNRLTRLRSFNIIIIIFNIMVQFDCDASFVFSCYISGEIFSFFLL